MINYLISEMSEKFHKDAYYPSIEGLLEFALVQLDGLEQIAELGASMTSKTLLATIVGSKESEFKTSSNMLALYLHSGNADGMKLLISQAKEDIKQYDDPKSSQEKETLKYAESLI